MRWNLYFLLGQVLDNVIKWPDAKKSGPATIYSLPTGWKCTQYTDFTGGFWKIPYIYGTFCIYGICRLSLTVGQILFNPLMEMWGYLLKSGIKYKFPLYCSFDPLYMGCEGMRVQVVEVLTWYSHPLRVRSGHPQDAKRLGCQQFWRDPHHTVYKFNISRKVKISLIIHEHELLMPL